MISQSVTDSNPKMKFDEKNRSSNKSSKIFYDIHKEPPMAKALDLISPLCENQKIILRAKGSSISQAVTVANIITNNLLKGKSQIYQTTVDSDPIVEMGGLESKIEIVLILKNSESKII